MDKGEYYMFSWTYVIKEFDSLDKGLVLRKLHHYGLRGTILEWYRSYFIGKRQKTKVNQCSSETKNVPFGTP